jgi:hypothetical protein
MLAVFYIVGKLACHTKGGLKVLESRVPRKILGLRGKK